MRHQTILQTATWIVLDLCRGMSVTGMGHDLESCARRQDMIGGLVGTVLVHWMLVTPWIRLLGLGTADTCTASSPW